MRCCLDFGAVDAARMLTVVLSGVVHNPKSDKRTTKGVLHVVDGGLPISGDKKVGVFTVSSLRVQRTLLSVFCMHRLLQTHADVAKGGAGMAVYARAATQCLRANRWSPRSPSPRCSSAPSALRMRAWSCPTVSVSLFACLCGYGGRMSRDTRGRGGKCCHRRFRAQANKRLFLHARTNPLQQPRARSCQAGGTDQDLHVAAAAPAGLPRGAGLRRGEDVRGMQCIAPCLRCTCA